MKRTIAMLIAGLMTMMVTAGQNISYKVLEITEGPVVVNGKPVEKGDILTSTAQIMWSNAEQSLKVWDGRRQIELFSDSYRGKENNIEYLVRATIGGPVIVDGKSVRVGDVLTSSSIIDWGDRRQGLKVWNGRKMLNLQPDKYYAGHKISLSQSFTERRRLTMAKRFVDSDKDKRNVSYKVLEITGGPVLVDGNPVEKGDILTSTAQIMWSNIKQSLKVWDGRRQIELVPVKNQIGEKISTSQAFTLAKGMTMRGASTTKSDHEDAFAALDTIAGNVAIETGWRCDHMTGFSLTYYKRNGVEITNLVPCDEGMLLFTPELFGVNSSWQQQKSMIVEISYVGVNGCTTKFAPLQICIFLE